jgi:hypothetical protein
VSDKKWSADFAVAVGSVAGREHLRLGRNNQDGAAVRLEPARIVAAVCDGCSAGRASEVGARMAAGFAVGALARLLDEGGDEAALPERLAADLCAWLRPIADGLGGDPAAVRDHLLFTVLVAAVEPERALVIGIGDGLYAIDGARTVLDAGPDNAPAYLGYRLVDPACLDRAPAEPPRLLARAGAIGSLILGTDGTAPLDLSALPGSFDNLSLLQKHLNVQQPRLSDDATLVVIRRRP